jgi:anti-sigma factor RsiW
MAEDDELSCKEVVELVTEYLEHALLPNQQQLVAAHLADCPGCAIYVAQIRTTITLLQHLTTTPEFPQNKRALHQIFQSWKSREDDSLASGT